MTNIYPIKPIAVNPKLSLFQRCRRLALSVKRNPAPQKVQTLRGRWVSLSLHPAYDQSPKHAEVHNG